MTLACEGSATQALEATRCGSFDFARRLATLRMTLHSVIGFEPFEIHYVLGLDLGDELDLDRETRGQLVDPDGGPRVATRVAEDLDEQVRRTVGNRRLLVEASGAVDEGSDAHQLL